jgi:hypothetical protein
VNEATERSPGPQNALAFQKKQCLTLVWLWLGFLHTEMLECFCDWVRQNLLLLWIWWLLMAMKRELALLCVYLGMPLLCEALWPLCLECHTLQHCKELSAVRYVNSTVWHRNYISWTSRALKSWIDQILLLPFSLEQHVGSDGFFCTRNSLALVALVLKVDSISSRAESALRALLTLLKFTVLCHNPCWSLLVTKTLSFL